MCIDPPVARAHGGRLAAAAPRYGVLSAFALFGVQHSRVVLFSAAAHVGEATADTYSLWGSTAKV